MLLGGGTLEGTTILRPETVKRFSSVHSGDLKTGFTPGNAWGIGCCIVCDPQGVTSDLEPGSYGHGGAYGTQAWIDPTRDRAYVLMVQRSNFPNSDASPVRAAFQQAARATAK
jgi:CubicO group peptidase (beta-lactamase class C family)